MFLELKPALCWCETRSLEAPDTTSLSGMARKRQRKLVTGFRATAGSLVPDGELWRGLVGMHQSHDVTLGH